MSMGKKKRSINRAKFGNYGHSKRVEPGQELDKTELRLLAVENSILLERQSVLKKRKEHGK